MIDALLPTLLGGSSITGRRTTDLVHPLLDARAAELYPQWDDAADISVALLHTAASRDPYDRDLSDLVGELSTRSESFRTLWARHDVRLHRAGIKRFRHPVVGDFELAYESMDLTADEGLVLIVYSPEPGTPSHDAVELPTSWVATERQQQPHIRVDD